VIVTVTKKCECSFKLEGNFVRNGECLALKVICGSHNIEMAETLVGHTYVGKLKLNEHFKVVDMTKSLVRSTNILFTLKENNKDNVTITKIKQVFNTNMHTIDH